jgi:hypothetical protein
MWLWKEGGSILFVKNRIKVYEMSRRWIGTMRIKGYMIILLYLYPLQIEL